MDEIRAAIGIHQLIHLDEISKNRKRIAKRHIEAINELDNITCYIPEKTVRHAYWRFPTLLDKSVNKEKLKAKLRKVGIEAGTLYPKPCHMHSLYTKLGYRRSNCPVAEKYLPRQLTLPIYPQMNESEINYVINNLKKELVSHKKQI